MGTAISRNDLLILANTHDDYRMPSAYMHPGMKIGSLVLPCPFAERKGLVKINILFCSKQQKFATRSLHSLTTAKRNNGQRLLATCMHKDTKLVKASAQLSVATLGYLTLKKLHSFLIALPFTLAQPYSHLYVSWLGEQLKLDYSTQNPTKLFS